MKNAIILFFIGLLQLYISFTLTGFKWLLIWSAASFMIVGMGYVCFGPSVYGKKPDGKLDKWRVVVLLPFLLLIWAKWHVHRFLTKEECWNKIIPDLYLGRRAYANELPDDIIMIVDLTAEFPVPENIKSKGFYMSCPVLDSSAMDIHRLKELVNSIIASRGGVYVHCALGHGRSATVVAAVLLAKGLAVDIEDAEKLLRRERAKVRLNRKQQRLLYRYLWELTVIKAI